jgi:hypothetical protein
MVLESKIEEELKNEVKNFKKCEKLLKHLTGDREIASLLEQANTVSITRMGFNDHGKVHSKIATLNALKIYGLLEARGIVGNIVKEEIGDGEDVRVALMLGAYLNDIGMCISRDSHDLLGVIVGKEIVLRLLKNIYVDTEKILRIQAVVLEEILCHMGDYRATSLEAKLVATADGTDMTKGRARIPYRISKPDIHQFSALAIEKVMIVEGEKKPVRIIVEMSDTAGIFQIEQELLQKIKDVGFQEYVEIVGRIKDGREFTYL